MSHPSTNFIKYQVLAGWPNESIDTINSLLTECALPEILPQEFDLLVAALQPPKVFKPASRSHKPTAAFMRAEGVFTLWSKARAAYDALALLELPQIRETIQLLLLGRISARAISERIKGKFNKSIPPEAITAYKHYIWNVDLIGMQEVKSYFWSSPMKDAYVACIWGSKNQALYRAGFNPKIDAKRALNEAHRSITMRIEATRAMPDTKDTARIVTSYAKELVTLHNALFGEGAGVEELMKELQSFVMERNAPNVVSIHKLAPKGNFSHGGGKKEEDAG